MDLNTNLVWVERSIYSIDDNEFGYIIFVHSVPAFICSHIPSRSLAGCLSLFHVKEVLAVGFDNSDDVDHTLIHRKARYHFMFETPSM